MNNSLPFNCKDLVDPYQQTMLVPPLVEPSSQWSNNSSCDHVIPLFPKSIKEPLGVIVNLFSLPPRKRS